MTEAHTRLRHHSPTANEYCPSSSTVARHFATIQNKTANPTRWTEVDYRYLIETDCSITTAGAMFLHFGFQNI